MYALKNYCTVFAHIYVAKSKNLLKRTIKTKNWVYSGCRSQSEYRKPYMLAANILKLKNFCDGGIKYKNFGMNLIKRVQGLYSKNLQETVAKEWTDTPCSRTRKLCFKDDSPNHLVRIIALIVLGFSELILRKLAKYKEPSS